MRLSTVHLAVALCVLLPGVRSAAQEPDWPPAARTVHFDIGSLPSRGAVDASLDLRVLGGDENLTYTSLGLSYALRDDLQAVVRAAFAGTKSRAVTSGVVRHGGNDVEIALRFGRQSDRPWSLLAGVAFPDTPAQNEAMPTLAATVEAWRGERGSAHLNLRTALVEDNEIVGLGIGGEARLTDRLALVGDYTFVATGDNTRSPVSGALRRRDVYGVALRFHTPDGRTTVDLGYANGAGLTTGFSLTPGLGGGEGGVYLAIRATR